MKWIVKPDADGTVQHNGQGDVAGRPVPEDPAPPNWPADQEWTPRAPVLAPGEIIITHPGWLGPYKAILVSADGSVEIGDDYRGWIGWDETGGRMEIHAMIGLPSNAVEEPPPVLAPGEKLAGFDRARNAWIVKKETKAERLAREAAELEAQRPQMQIGSVDLSLALLRAGKVTATEAEEFAANGALSERLAAAIATVMTAARMTAEQQAEARIRLKGLMTYQRVAPEVEMLGRALDMTPAELDRLFAGLDPA